MTALQELINNWTLEMESNIANAPIYRQFIEEAKLNLKKEKQQIIDAYNSGAFENFQVYKAEDYFNDKYN